VWGVKGDFRKKGKKLEHKGRVIFGVMSWDFPDTNHVGTVKGGELWKSPNGSGTLASREICLFDWSANKSTRSWRGTIARGSTIPAPVEKMLN